MDSHPHVQESGRDGCLAVADRWPSTAGRLASALIGSAVFNGRRGQFLRPTLSSVGIATLFRPARRATLREGEGASENTCPVEGTEHVATIHARTIDAMSSLVSIHQ